MSTTASTTVSTPLREAVRATDDNGGNINYGGKMVKQMLAPLNAVVVAFLRRPELDEADEKTRLRLWEETWTATVTVAAPKTTRKKAPGTAAHGRTTDRAPSAYTTFCRERRQIIREQNPSASFGDISKLLGKEWRAKKEADKLAAAAGLPEAETLTETVGDDAGRIVPETPAVASSVREEGVGGIVTTRSRRDGERTRPREHRGGFLLNNLLAEGGNDDAEEEDEELPATSSTFTVGAPDTAAAAAVTRPLRRVEEEENTDDVRFDRMSLKELKDLCGRLNIEHKGVKQKAALIARLEEHYREAARPSSPDRAEDDSTERGDDDDGNVTEEEEAGSYLDYI